MTNSTLTTKARFENAIAEAEENGVVITENVEPYHGCRCCIMESDLGLEDGDETTPYAFTLGIQDGEGYGYEWKHDSLIRYWDESYEIYCGDDEDEDDDDYETYTERHRGGSVHKVEFNHANGAGETVAQAFRNHGFTVEWDGTENDRVTVLV